MDKILVRDLTKTFPTRYGVVAALEHLDLVAVVLYSPAMRREKVDQGRRFMEAYLRALRDYNDVFVKKQFQKRRDVISALVDDRFVLSALEKLGRYR